jgi:hypothetical protein
MANPKKEDVVEEVVAAPAASSNIDWDAYLENLKEKNPAKYELKKAEYQARVKNA